METRIACAICDSQPQIGTETNVKCGCGGKCIVKGFDFNEQITMIRQGLESLEIVYNLGEDLTAHRDKVYNALKLINAGVNSLKS